MNILPSVKQYTEYLSRITTIKNITINQARNLYGLYSIREWESLLNITEKENK